MRACLKSRPKMGHLEDGGGVGVLNGRWSFSRQTQVDQWGLPAAAFTPRLRLGVPTRAVFTLAGQRPCRRFASVARQTLRETAGAAGRRAPRPSLKPFLFPLIRSLLHLHLISPPHPPPRLPHPPNGVLTFCSSKGETLSGCC